MTIDMFNKLTGHETLHPQICMIDLSKTNLSEDIRIMCDFYGLLYYNSPIKRDSHNYRVFDDRDIKWIQSLGCLKRCGMTLAEMKEYLAYCLEGPSSIPERKEILAVKKEALLASMEKLQKAIDYIDWKQNFYDDVLSGKIEYHSNLISDEEIAQKAQ